MWTSGLQDGPGPQRSLVQRWTVVVCRGITCEVHGDGPWSLLGQQRQSGHLHVGQAGIWGGATCTACPAAPPRRSPLGPGPKPIPTTGGRVPSSARLYWARLWSSGSSCRISSTLFFPGAWYSGTASSTASSSAAGPPSLSARRTGVGEGASAAPTADPGSCALLELPPWTAVPPTARRD